MNTNTKLIVCGTAKIKFIVEMITIQRHVMLD